jgi:hypothetical protein
MIGMAKLELRNGSAELGNTYFDATAQFQPGGFNTN